MTLKDLLDNTVKELKISDIKSISIVVNDLGPRYKPYGKYAYSYNKGESRM
jgi:hypothetical protein